MSALCLYWRRSSATEWQLVADHFASLEKAHQMARGYASTRQVGRLALVRVDTPSSSTWDLRSLTIRASYANQLCKAMLPTLYRAIVVGGKRQWVRVDKRQMSLFG